MKVGKILIIGAANPGAIEHLFMAGFKRQGAEVEIFDSYDRYIRTISRSVVNKVLNKISPAIFYRAINRDLLQHVASRKYDVILIIKGMEFFPETLAGLKKSTKVLANYNPDHPFIYFFPGSGNDNVRKGIPFFDVHFSYSRSIVQKFKSDYNIDAYCVPFGYDSHATAASTQGHATSVAGAGNNFAAEGSTLSFADEFVFIGAYDKERGSYLDQLKSPLLQIYGDEKWRTRNVHRPYLQKAFQDRALYGRDYTDAVRNSRGVINLLREQNAIEDSHNMRTFEVPGFGGLLITQRTSEQQDFFEEDKEAVFFDTMDELRSKMEFLSSNPSLISSMKAAALRRSEKSGYSYDDRSLQMLHYLEKFL